MVKLFERLGQWLVDLCLQNRGLTIVVMLAVTASFAPPMGNLGISSEYRAYFGSDNPQLLAFDALEDNYAEIDAALFVVQPADKDIFSQQSYPIIQKLTEMAWFLPTVTRVDSISNYQHTKAEGDELTVQDLLPLDEEFTEQQLREKRAIALAEPTIAGSLIAHDGETAGISARVDTTADPNVGLPMLVDAAREMIAEIEAAYPNTKIAATGNAFMSNAFREAAQDDSMRLIPLMYLVLFIVMSLVYRNGWATLITIVVVISSTIVALGVGGLFKIELTSMSVPIPIVVMTLAVADSVHILVSALTLMRSGMERVAAIRESMRINFVAVAVTSITTIIGFLCLNFSDTPPFAHLGNLSSVGIFAAWIISVTLVPALFAVLPIKVKVAQANQNINVGEGQGKTEVDKQMLVPFSLRLMRSLAVITIHHSKKILVASAAIGAVLISAIPQLEFDDQFINFFDKSLDFRTDTDFTIEELSGIYALHYDIRSGEDSGITDPDYLKNLLSLTDWLRQQEEVRAVFSFTDIMKRLNKSMHGDEEEWYRLPDDKELAAQYLLLYELSLPYGLDLTDRITYDKSGTRLTVTLDKITSSQLREFSARTKSWMQQNIPSQMHSTGSGTSMMFAYITKRNFDSMVVGNTIAVVLIGLVMILALQHFGLGVLSMVPNLLPVVFAFGVWSLLFGVIGLAGTTVMALSLGIVVDNTTHFLSKYQRAKSEQGASTAEAIKYAFEIVGMALLANAIILAIGFAILVFSSFSPNVHMGALTAGVIVLALIIDLLLLPALLMLLSGGDSARDDRRKSVTA